MSSKKEDEGEGESITLPGDKTYCGISYKQNEDGTKTWYPPTTVAFFSAGDYELIKLRLPAEELKLITKNLVKGISDTDEYRKKRFNLPNESPEWKEALDVKYSIRQASEKEYLFVAQRHFEEQEVVAIAHLSLGFKNTCVAESMPARVSVFRQTTIDVCRGKTEYALRQLLKKVRDFYEAWASFQIQVDKVEHGGLDYLSCDYKLILPVPHDSDDLSSHLGKRVEEFVADGVWNRPTAQMCQSWGYETTKAFGRSGATKDETFFLVCKKP